MSTLYQDVKKRVEVLKARVKGELMVLDKLLDLDDPRELEESWMRLSELVIGIRDAKVYGGLIYYMERLKDLEKEKEEVET